MKLHFDRKMFLDKFFSFHAEQTIIHTVDQYVHTYLTTMYKFLGSTSSENLQKFTSRYKLVVGPKVGSKRFHKIDPRSGSCTSSWPCVSWAAWPPPWAGEKGFPETWARRATSSSGNVGKKND
jgi:hypothetical protein